MKHIVKQRGHGMQDIIVRGVIIMKKLVFIIVFLLFFSSLFYPFFESVKANPGNIFTIWVCSDMHVNSHTTPAEWSDCISDVVGINPDYNFNLGDTTDWPDGTPETDWDYFYNNSGQTYGWNDVEGFVNYTNFTVGNHDGGWGIHLLGQQRNWTYTLGNIMFIGIGDEFPNENDYDCIGGGACNTPGWYMYALDWVNQTIQNNQDKNIIILCHMALTDTTYNTNGIYAMRYENDTAYKEMLNWSEDNGYHVDAWVHGHSHIAADELNMVEKYGTLWVSDLAISDSGKGTQDSIFLDIEDGNKTVTIKGRRHDSPSWYSTAYFPYTFNLTYAFDEDYTETEAYWISINNQGNTTSLSESWRNYSGNSFQNPLFYQIQVSNTSNFADPFVNLYANNSNLGSNFYDDSTLFWANDTNTIESYGGDVDIHYYRYRTRYRTVTE